MEVYYNQTFSDLPFLWYYKLTFQNMFNFWRGIRACKEIDFFQSSVAFVVDHIGVNSPLQ